RLFPIDCSASSLWLCPAKGLHSLVGCSKSEELNGPEGFPKLDPEQWPGTKHIAKCYGTICGKSSVFVAYEFGGVALSTLVRDVKGEFVGQKRMYRLLEKPLYTLMRQDPRILKCLLRDMLHVLDMLAHLKWIHSDIKPDNILVLSSPGSTSVGEIKIIDFGSAFRHGTSATPLMATPEYMPPEALRAADTAPELRVSDRHIRVSLPLLLLSGFESSSEGHGANRRIFLVGD
ncbi:protein kinase domain containing protein, partial [Cystoisospora suis]